MIFTPKNKFDLFLHRQLFYWRFKRNFAGISVKNFENAVSVISESQKNKIPVIFCSNHPNWWDVSLAIFLTLEYFKIDSYFLISNNEKINKKFNKVGVVKFENIAEETILISEYLKDSSKFLWIFPQSEITDNNKEIIFSTVVSDLVENIKEVILINCMLEYRFADEKKPEIFLDFFESKNFTGISYLNKESFTMNLEQKFEFKIKEFKKKFANRDTKDFKRILDGQKLK